MNHSSRPPRARPADKRLLFATRNRGKLRELAALLADTGFEVLGLHEVPGIEDVEETGATFAENALIKARAAMEATGLLALADDSGLEVDALDGAPGVRSARYAGPGASDADRIALLLRNLEATPDPARTARFRCAVALSDPHDPEHPTICEGTCEGHILRAPRGSLGFGYDPVFFSPELGMTFAEADEPAKNQVSHRGRAMTALRPVLLARRTDV